jgi:hypothetical protein
VVEESAIASVLVARKQWSPATVTKSRQCVDASGASRRWQCHPRDRTRVRTMGALAVVNLVTFINGSHLLFIWHCVTGAHQSYLAGRPRSGRGSKALGQLGGDQRNTRKQPIASC